MNYGLKRIYGFLAERFLSYWFNKNYKVVGQKLALITNGHSIQPHMAAQMSMKRQSQKHMTDQHKHCLNFATRMVAALPK